MLTDLIHAYQSCKNDLAEPFRLRIPRALSWLKKAEGMDTRFMALWIAFNAAYAREKGAWRSADKTMFVDFLQRICLPDAGQRLYDLVRQRFPSSIRVLSDTPYSFQACWDYHNSLVSEVAWQTDFARAK